MSLKLPIVFTDNMVLQRNKNINIWGYSYNSDNVTIRFNGQVNRIKVNNNKWRFVLSSMEAGGPYRMEIIDNDDKLVLNNIMIGEVWLAGGQSNMELELQNSKNGKYVVENIENDNIRFFNVPRLSYIEDDSSEKIEKNIWEECNSKNVGTWSAVGYYYAKELSKKLGVTIGVIGCNFGGTSASAWISKGKLIEDIDTKHILMNTMKLIKIEVLKNTL